MKNPKIMILIVVIVIVLAIVAFMLLKNPAQELPFADNKDICEQGGGTRLQFPNTCGDSCIYIRNKGDILCGQAFVDACDCGPDKCWNGESCESN